MSVCAELEVVGDIEQATHAADVARLVEEAGGDEEGMAVREEPLGTHTSQEAIAEGGDGFGAELLLEVFATELWLEVPLAQIHIIQGMLDAEGGLCAELGIRQELAGHEGIGEAYELRRGDGGDVVGRRIETAGGDVGPAFGRIFLEGDFGMVGEHVRERDVGKETWDEAQRPIQIEGLVGHLAV